MSFELDLPRDVVPPMVACELRKLEVEAVDARVDDGLWTITLKDGRTIQMWYAWSSTYGFWHARFGGRNYTITYDRESDALRRVLKGEPPPEPLFGGSLERIA
jgi:hypothetical protein